jgi:hypothetical protein
MEDRRMEFVGVGGLRVIGPSENSATWICSLPETDEMEMKVQALVA